MYADDVDIIGMEFVNTKEAKSEHWQDKINNPNERRNYLERNSGILDGDTGDVERRKHLSTIDVTKLKNQ